MERPRKQTCSKCPELARSKSNRYCNKHHAEHMRNWRKTHRLTGETRKRMNCRSYLHVYVKRGTIKKGPCEVCGNPNVEAHHEDYDKPLEVHWFCRPHHLEVTAGRIKLQPA